MPTPLLPPLTDGIVPLTRDKDAEIRECPHDPHADQEILDSIETDYYTPPAQFDAGLYELQVSKPIIPSTDYRKFS